MRNNTSNENYIRVAHGIGSQLCKTAFWHDDTCNWIGLEVNEKTGYSFHRTLEYNFYEGTSGISFFLSQLYSLTGENIFKRTAKGALNHAIIFAAKYPGKNPLGFYFGKTGLLYAMICASDILNDSLYLQKASTLSKEILNTKTNKLHFDIINGAAGAIPALLFASGKLKTADLKELAVELGDYLLKHSIVFENTRSWKSTKQKHLPLTGFSHGASGVGYAMALLFKFTRDKKYADAAIETFNYEDKYFNIGKNNWADLRDISSDDKDEMKNARLMSAWCYGAPGIGMARLAAYRILKHDKLLQMVEHACSNVVSSFESFGNHSLCHGCFGNAELLLQYSNIFKNNTYRKELNRIALNGMTEYFEEGIPWSCGTPDRIYTPSFMTGTAGIGNYYLRMHSPHKIASGLILEELL